ncbi:hypothetical protein F2P81_006091 [Scophthalmus maximus]|uniref:Uncharacterized protein n=1 Tax=Scophthalmus maximus TaxID=52904 RepID=A0A6A4TCG0_SCOMX|nr:hypothetical protein F2P81_006091 [Scophthalmus maximus]
MKEVVNRSSQSQRHTGARQNRKPEDGGGGALQLGFVFSKSNFGVVGFHSSFSTVDSRVHKFTDYLLNWNPVDGC